MWVRGLGDNALLSSPANVRMGSRKGGLLFLERRSCFGEGSMSVARKDQKYYDNKCVRRKQGFDGNRLSLVSSMWKMADVC